MKLLTSTPVSKAAGTYNILMVMSSGDAKLQYSTDELTFTDIPTSTKTASTGFEIDLPSCQIQSVITGDAEVSISQVRR